MQHIQKPEDGHKLLHTYKQVENLENKQTLFSRKGQFDSMLHHLFVHFIFYFIFSLQMMCRAHLPCTQNELICLCTDYQQFKCH